jgi:hypothetical protein
MKRVDLTQSKEPFGSWTVLRNAGKNKHGQSMYLCRCVCGTEKLVMVGHLTSGASRSCGCKTGEVIAKQKTTHGMSRSRTYRIWQAMMRRCYEPDFASYKDYGARGVRVEERWHKFEHFLADMGECPAGLTLDRRDGGDYGPGRCRWATRRTQRENRVDTIWVEHEGRRQTLQEWSEETGIDRDTLYQRLFRLQWTIERALTTPPGPRGKARPGFQQDPKNKARHEVYLALKEDLIDKPAHCQHPGCNETKIQAHHHNGYAMEHALDVQWFCPKHHPREHERQITFNGETKSLREWSELTGVARATIWARYLKSGQVATEATFRPVPKQKGHVVTYNGETGNLTYWAERLGIGLCALCQRLKKKPAYEVIERALRARSEKINQTPTGS